MFISVLSAEILGQLSSHTKPGTLTSPLVDGVHCQFGRPVTALPPGTPITRAQPAMAPLPTGTNNTCLSSKESEEGDLC